MANLTCIKLKATDQQLLLLQQPVLASGDVGTVIAEYETDSQWNGYALSGTFYTDKRPGDIYMAPLTAGACTIPWEVLREEGFLFIGLRGVDDKGLVKTAAAVRYRIKPGSPCGQDPAPAPSPDIYEQLLTKIGQLEEQIAGGGTALPSGDEVRY